MAKKKQILITGGSGFVGRNLAEQLGKKFDIIAPGSAELDLFDAEKTARYLKQNPVDVVVHGANVGGNRKAAVDNLVEKNLRMFFNVARCSKHFGKMIQLGSGAEYDKAHYLPKMKEEYFDTHVPADDYGFYKYVCAKFIEKSDTPITSLRIFGCYGKYEDYEIKFISNAICKAVFGLPMTIANRNVRFDYLYVNDLARIVEHFIEKDGRHKFYNVTPDESVDLLSIAKLINRVSGKDLPIMVKNPGMGVEYSGDNALLKKEMPGFAFTPLESGVHQLYEWYAQNKGKINIKKISQDRY